MSAEVFQKYEKLKHLVRSYSQVGVAFSGGIDSSLLLFAAGEVLGKDNVLAVHGRSRLNISDLDIEELFSRCFSGIAQLSIVDVDPLTWPEFVNNDDRRCYHCKKKTYTAFRERLAERGIGTLLDGTNSDDMLEERPGLVFLKESGVITPLVDAELTKKDIRFLARVFGLPHHSKPSNSCLATRLKFFLRIEDGELRRVDEIESKLKKMGFTACRVRPQKDVMIIEIRQQEFSEICRKHKRLRISELAAEYGFSKVFLDLEGRQ